MDIVYAAEKSSIAGLVSDHLKRRVREQDIDVRENPNETGSFYIGLEFERFVMTPDGRIVERVLELLD